MPATSETVAAAARSLFTEGGSHAITVRAVAKAVGFTPMALYKHFPTREALLRTVTESEFETLHRHMLDRMKRVPPSTKPRLVLTELLEGCLDYAFAHPHTFDSLFLDPARDGQDRHHRLAAVLEPVKALVTSWMASGGLAKDDPAEVALAIWAETLGLLVLYRAGHLAQSPDDFRALYRRSLKRLLNGVRS